MTKSLRRRQLLVSISLMSAFATVSARAATYSGSLPFLSNDDTLPDTPRTDGWTFFAPAEATAIGALVDRLIPSDDLSPGGREAGIDVYIDRQLSGDFGKSAGLYMQPPFADGPPGFGPQSALTPAERYRKSLAAIDQYVKSAYMGKAFADIPVAEQDKLITAMASGDLKLSGVSSKAFFQLLWQNAKEGFFADPIYGGNKNMAGWKLVGFPGARYDYRNWIDNQNKPYPYPPVGIATHPDWSRPS